MKKSYNSLQPRNSSELVTIRVPFCTAILFFAFLILASGVSAAGYGAYSTTLSTQFINITAGKIVSVNYTVDLISGTPSNVIVVAENVFALRKIGITLNVSKTSGYPPFSGVLTISAAQTATNGNHIVRLFANGSNVSGSARSLLHVQVFEGTPRTTIPMTTTIASTYPSGSYPIGSILLVLAVAAVIIAVVYMLVKRGKRPPEISIES